MADSTREERIETLLGHAAWVRGLARSLILDQDRVDDVVQQTWLVALQKRPRGIENVAAWLGRVVRHTAVQQRRSESRRIHREEVSARPEALPPADELVEQAELQRELVTEVLRLPETHRTAILLRYYHGHSPKEIAALQGVPPGTVRSRLKRALESLRERLDDRCGGDRQVWSLRVIPLALSREGGKIAAGLSPPAVGGIVMGWKLMFTALAAALALTIVWIAWPDDASEPPKPRQADSVTVLGAPSDSERIALAEKVEVEGGAEHPARREAAASEPTVQETDDALAIVHGELRAPDGSPAAGVVLQVDGRWPDRRNERGPVAEIPSGKVAWTTGQDGSFSISLKAITGYEYMLRATPRGHAEMWLTVGELQTAQRKELGTFTMVVAGVVEGRVVRETGEAFPGEWRVRGNSSVGVDWLEGGYLPLGADVDPESATFRLEGVPDGSFRIEPLPAEDVAVYCVIPTWQTTVGKGFTWEMGGSRHLLGRARIRPEGDTEQDFSLARILPGSTRVRVLIAGETASGAFVLARRVSEDGVPEGVQVGQACDPDGMVKLDYMAAGTWEFRVRPFSLDWCHKHPEQVVLPPGNALELTISIEVAGGSVTLVDEISGKPLAEETIYVLPRDAVDHEFDRERKTDSEGRIELRLAVGSYLVTRQRRYVSGRAVPGDLARPMEWTTSGPAEPELALPAPPPR